MNTPPKKRRWASDLVSPLWTNKARSGTFTLGIHNAEAAEIFAALMSEFVFLEQAMEFVLDRLLHTKQNVAGHISRTILSPATRVEMMRALLENAPHNSTKPDCYDEIIREFKEISRLRNHYAHGKWETDDENGELYLVRPKEDPYMLGSLVAEKFDLAEMQDVRARIITLWMKVYRDIGVAPPPNGD